MDTAVKIKGLRDGAKLILASGLAKGMYRREDEANPAPPLECPHCAMGALLDVIYPGRLKMNSPGLTPVEDLLGDLLEDLATEISPGKVERGGEPWHIISKWSDEYDRTERDVAELFERVAKKLEA